MSTDNKSCYKCGKIGHLGNECHESTIPLKIKEYEEKEQNEIFKVYSNALQNEQYQQDEFGPFFPDPPSEKNIGHNWSNDIFCFNCGESGHSEDKCQHPSFESFYKTIQNVLENESDNVDSKIKQEFENIWNDKSNI